MMPFAKKSGAPSQIDQKLKTKRQQIIEEERIRVLCDSLLLFYSKLIEKYVLIHPNKEEVENNIPVAKEEIVKFTEEYAKTKPLGF